MGPDLGSEHAVLAFAAAAEQRAGEVAPRPGEQQLQAFIDCMPIGAGLVSPDGTLLYFNAVAAEIFGVESAGKQSRSLRDGSWWAIREDGSILLPEDTALGRAMACREPVRNVVEGVMHGLRTEPVWVEMSAIPNFDAEGTAIGIIVTTVDITARKRAEATSALYAELPRQLPIGFTAWHPDDVGDAHSLRLIAANEATGRFAGKALDSMIGRTIQVPPPGAGHPLLPS